MKTIIFFLLIALMGATGAACKDAGADYSYISAADLKVRLDNDSDMILIDVCPLQLFARKHIKGALGTNAYPVKTEKERARLAATLPKLVEESTSDIVIICPRGRESAIRTVDFYRSKGVNPNRMFILEKGMLQWPYETQNASPDPSDLQGDDGYRHLFIRIAKPQRNH
jgi:rhodanese-related sulfurtransferase